VAVKIKLKRMGKIHAPYYRIIVADARTTSVLLPLPPSIETSVPQ